MSFSVSSFFFAPKKKRKREADDDDLLCDKDQTVVKKAHVVDELELFDDEAVWEDVVEPPKPNTVSEARASVEPQTPASISGSATPFSAFSRSAPPTSVGSSASARRALLAADFGLKDEMEEWKASKCPWLDDIRDANLRRPGDEGYNKSTLYISPQQLSSLSVPQRQYWSIKSRYFDWVVWFQVLSPFFLKFIFDCLMYETSKGRVVF